MINHIFPPNKMNLRRVEGFIMAIAIEHHGGQETMYAHTPTLQIAQMATAIQLSATVQQKRVGPGR